MIDSSKKTTDPTELEAHIPINKEDTKKEWYALK